MMPSMVMHNAIRLNVRLDGFPVNPQQYYELVGIWKEDAILAGSDTIIKAEAEAPPEYKGTFVPPEEPGDIRALLAIPDSRGKIRIWHYLRQSLFGSWNNPQSETKKSFNLDLQLEVGSWRR